MKFAQKFYNIFVLSFKILKSLDVSSFFFYFLLFEQIVSPLYALHLLQLLFIKFQSTFKFPSVVKVSSSISLTISSCFNGELCC